MLEGVLDEGDEQQRRYLALRHLAGQLHLDAHILRIAQLHQRNVMADEVQLARQRHTLFVALVEYEAHHLRQFDDGFLRLRRVDVDKSVDVVERIHEEVRIYLVAQVLQLLLQILTLQLDQPPTVVATAEINLDTKIHSEHHHQHYHRHDVALADDDRGCLTIAHLRARPV